MTRTKELPSSMNSPPTRTVLPPRTMGKKITRPGMSIPSKPWNMPIKQSSGHKKRMGSPQNQRENRRVGVTALQECED
jgi:hypothetical protein